MKCYFKHIVLLFTKQLDRTQVSQLRNDYSNTYMNKYKMNLYNVIYIFHILSEDMKKKLTNTKNVEHHANGLSELKYT